MKDNREGLVGYSYIINIIFIKKGESKRIPRYIY